MFITNFFASLIRQNNKKTNRSKKKRPLLTLPPSKEESIRLALLQSERHAEKKKWKPAIKALDQALNRGVSNNKLLIQKGLLLAKTHQFKEAKTILQSLIDKKAGRNLTRESRKALRAVNNLQKETTATNRAFLKKLHHLITNSNQKITHLPEPKQYKIGQDLIGPLRKEAGLARSQKRYALSLQLLDSGLEHGLESSWLLYEKSLTLKAKGQFEGASAILKSLAKSKGKDRLAARAQRSLNDLDRDKERFAKQRTINLIRHFSSIASDHQWSLCHLPKKAGKGNIKDPKEMAFKEARAALQADEAELCIDFIEAMLLYYDKNQKAQLIKAQALSKLGHTNQAIETLKELAAGDGKFSDKAKESLREAWTAQALEDCTKKSPKKAIHFFISRHLNSGINPEYNPQLDDVLKQFNPSEELYSQPDLRQHQLNLRFNGELLELLEARLLKQNLDREPKPQRKKASSARLAGK